MQVQKHQGAAGTPRGHRDTPGAPWLSASQHHGGPTPPRRLAAPPTPSYLRRLQQFAGLTNLAVGYGKAASMKALNVAGVASQLYSFYGPDGVGIRSQLGAMPAPGGLEMLLLKGPLGMPGPPLGPNIGRGHTSSSSSSSSSSTWYA
jgi:hypothetical protein